MSELIGVRRPRVDALGKVTGATRYAADRHVPGLLHARLVLSWEAHASIAGVDTGAALDVPGVVAVLTADDLPTSSSGSNRSSRPLASGEVVFAGQPVAVVVAETEAAAEDGAEAVVVDYSPLTPVLDLEAAMAPGAPLARQPVEEDESSDLESAHTAAGGGEDELPAEELSGNVLSRAYYADGDVEAALAASHAVVAGRFATPWIHQGYVEPQTATAWLDPDGTLVVSSATQGTFVTRSELARVFDLPLHKVRVEGAPLGGAFGGKFALIEPLVAGVCLALRRPVRLALTRSEDFAATNPASAEIIELRVGASADGTFTALDARVVADRGENADWGVEDISSILVAGPYRWPAFRIRGYGVQTNRVTFGAYRGPGAPPAAFALESLVDELAGALGLDPIDLRLRNVVQEGDAGVTGRPFPVMGARECLERIREHPAWRERERLPQDEGVGVALGYWPGGNEPASSVCRLDSDGGLTVITGAVDMTGTETGFATIAAAAFGLPLERVRVVAADTSAAVYSGASGGSKVTYTVGRAVQRAAEAARERLLRIAAEELEIAPDDLEVVDGMVRARGAPDKAISVEDIAGKTLRFGSRYEPVEGHGSTAQTSLAPSAAAHLAHVRVDRDTGVVEVLRFAIAQDVGRALNPALVEGQMKGGVAQALGWALYEELVHDEQGQLVTGTFLDYAVPNAERVPDIDALIVEVPAPDGPFGAKGIGEAPVIAGPAAVANAVHAAAGVRLRELPMTPPRVWAALQSSV
jgi:CO/xanthine dehydrogenase Mo-binding subunit